MKILYFYIIAASIVVLVATLILLFPVPVNNTIMITPSVLHQDKIRQTIDVQKARQLAENNIDGLTTSYACHFDSESEMYSNFPNGTSKLEGVRIGYNCNSPYVASFIIVEDPLLTKVINVTSLEPRSTLPEH